MKTNFIKAKYENLTFIARGKYSSIEELNQVTKIMLNKQAEIVNLMFGSN